MTGEEITDQDLMGVFEAARWAPSSYNNHPALIVLVATKNFEFNEKPARTNQFDAGPAWKNLALEATFRLCKVDLLSRV
jgi:nitroreductase